MPQITIITPTGVTNVELNEELKTVADALDQTELDESRLVKLNGRIVSEDTTLVEGGVYLIIPGTVAKGGFPGAA